MVFIDQINELKSTYHTHNGIDSPKIPTPYLSYKSVQSGITAAIGSTQATGVKISTDIVEISVCANIGDSLTLPTASKGLQILIINHGAQSADIFPNLADKINEAAVDTAKALAADASMLCTAYDSTNWETATFSR